MRGVGWLIRTLINKSDENHDQSCDSSRKKESLLDTGTFATDWLQKIRAAAQLFPVVDSNSLHKLKECLPDQVKETIDAADSILMHEFNLLGSGPYYPVDPERKKNGGYQPIDWYLDPVSGLRFPKGINHKQWDLWKMRPGSADVKLPWELARCQHWPVLAQAWLLSGEMRYAQEIFQQRADFDEANPIGYGINWTCTMDIAIRAANWALALEMIRDCEVADAEWLAAYRSLYAHGQFIRANLEDKYEVTSNHFLSNVVGLYYLSRVFRESVEAQEWETFSRDALEREINIQILPDGADFESSVPYHRLVTELFLGVSRVANSAAEPFSAHFMSRLHDMLSYHLAVLRPDGRMPQLGDADDGRLHIFTGYGRAKPQDGRHLLASGGVILNEPIWISYTGMQGVWEAFWWSGKVVEMPLEQVALPDIDKQFPDAGVIVHRSNNAYLVITNGIVGTKGFGNHKHNDLLAYEYHDWGIPLFVDPGSYVYTSDLSARKLFRGTGYHNTLLIDAVEQNEMNPQWIFRLFEKATPETIEYFATPETVFYRGQHRGYARLDNPVIHERTFTFDRLSKTLWIDDLLQGEGLHKVLWHFHLAPDILVRQMTRELRLCHQKSGKEWLFSYPETFNVQSVAAWYSPSYGVRIPCRAIELEAEVSLSPDTIEAPKRFAIRRASH